MKESLKFISVLHQVVIAVCGAVIAFSVSPDKSREYRAALKELTDLATVQHYQISNYQRFVQENVPTEEQPSNGFPQALAQLGFGQLAKDFFVPRSVYVESPGTEISVQEFLQWLESDKAKNLIVRYDPSTLTLRNKDAALEQAKAIPAACLPTHLAVEPHGFPFSPEPQFVLGAPTGGMFPIYLSYRTSDQDSNCNFQIEFSVKASVESLRGTGGAAWSRTLKSADSFSHIKAIFDEIGSKKVDEAVKYLQEKLNTPEQQLSFLGIKVQPGTAAWIGPIITLMLVLFALAHLQHLLPLIRQSKEVGDYPWVGVFREPLGVALTYGSIVLLPTLANLSLILRAWRAADATWHFGVACVILIFITGVLSGIEIHRIHKARSSTDRNVEVKEHDERAR